METSTEEISPRKARQYVRNMSKELANRLDRSNSSEPLKVANRLFQKLFERGFADVVVVPEKERDNLYSQISNFEFQKDSQPYYLIKVTDDEIKNPAPSDEQFQLFAKQVIDCIAFWDQQSPRVKSEILEANA